jgi:microsomal dipeptidase-like Zn-dependent dipeptidase
VQRRVQGVATKSPRHLNIERNDDRSDDITLLALGRGWPAKTWRSLNARALHLGRQLEATANRSDGTLTLVRSAADLEAFLTRRAANPGPVAGLLAIEGAHALGPDLAGLDAIDEAGFRMVGLAHFFDNAVPGSAHGIVKGGLTALGRELIAELEPGIVDLAHSSRATIDDVLTLAQRPVVASHTGVRGVADNARNLPDEQLRGIAATGGMVGIGFWPTACGGADAGAIARSIAYAASVAGVDHVGLGSDFDGGVAVLLDASGMALITEALLDEGLTRPRSARSWATTRSGCCARRCPRSDRFDRPAESRRVRYAPRLEPAPSRPLPGRPVAGVFFRFRRLPLDGPRHDRAAHLSHPGRRAVVRIGVPVRRVLRPCCRRAWSVGGAGHEQRRQEAQDRQGDRRPRDHDRHRRLDAVAGERPVLRVDR